MAGRFQTHTVVPEGSELDENYQKTVADIEEQTQRSGWLFGRGALDKADLQYLRDFNNSLRYKEVEIEDKEKQLWERERARVEAETAAAASEHMASALKRRSSGGSGAAGGSAAATAGLRGPAGLASRPAPLMLPVKVKPAGSRQQTTPQGRPTSPPAPGGPAASGSCKRPKTDDGRAGASGQAFTPFTSHVAGAISESLIRSHGSHGDGATAAQQATGTAAASEGAVCSSGAVPSAGAWPSQAGGGAGMHGPQQLGRSVSAPAAAAAPAADSRKHTGDGGPGEAGLATLLSGYGSEDSEGEAEEEGKDGHKGAGADGVLADARAPQGHTDCDPLSQQPSGTAQPGRGQPAVKLPPPVGLLSPEELLNDPRVLDEGLLATRPVPQAVRGGDAWDSGEASGSGSD